MMMMLVMMRMMTMTTASSGHLIPRHVEVPHLPAALDALAQRLQAIARQADGQQAAAGADRRHALCREEGRTKARRREGEGSQYRSRLPVCVIGRKQAMSLCKQSYTTFVNLSVVTN
jgi:hypothetical protein